MQSPSGGRTFYDEKIIVEEQFLYSNSTTEYYPSGAYQTEPRSAIPKESNSWKFEYDFRLFIGIKGSFEIKKR